MKIKLNEDQYSNLKTRIETAKLPEPLAQETDEEWEKYVSEPVKRYPLSPREARAILEVFGTLSSFGLRAAPILDDLMLMYTRKAVSQETLIVEIKTLLPTDFKLKDLRNDSVEKLELIVDTIRRKISNGIHTTTNSFN